MLELKEHYQLAVILRPCFITKGLAWDLTTQLLEEPEREDMY